MIGRLTCRSLAIFTVFLLAFVSPLAAKDKLPTNGGGWGFKRITDDGPKLPRVLLIGDSIANGYHVRVAELLKGKANVDLYVTGKNIASGGVLEDLEKALSQGPYRVVHFNESGLHAWQKGRVAAGQYGQLFAAYVETLKKHAAGATLIWASTTPMTVKDHPDQLDKENDATVMEHNQAARKVVDREKIAVNDLHALMMDKLKLARGDRFHWTKAGSDVQAEAVAAKIRAAMEERTPNIVLIYIDDMGYADIGPFGAKGYATPHLDRMAAEGIKFTSFYSAQAVCSASRAALMTGCYANRVGIQGALGPHARVGISDKEMTIAQLCKQKNYATAIFGKWHLGDAPRFLPTRHGFDEYFGLPYSNDMWPQHNPKWPPLPLIEQERVINPAVDDAVQNQLTTLYTERAVSFIERNRARPFFLYVPHTMVHVPLHVSDKFRGKTARGLFGDVVEEVDWSVGQILDAIKRNGLDNDTLVFFCSDNGPWLCYGDHAGSAYPLREGKGTSWDGGVREPTLMRWPGHIPAGKTCDAPLMTIDMLPTIARLIGGRLPEHKIDGLDISDVILGRSTQSPHEVLYYYYHVNSLEALRSGKWKLELPRTYQSLNGRPGGHGGKPVRYDMLKVHGPELYDLNVDPGQKHNVAEKYPEVLAKMLAYAEQAREELGDDLTDHEGSGRREPGRLP